MSNQDIVAAIKKRLEGLYLGDLAATQGRTVLSALTSDHNHVFISFDDGTWTYIYSYVNFDSDTAHLSTELYMSSMIAYYADELLRIGVISGDEAAEIATYLENERNELTELTLAADLSRMYELAQKYPDKFHSIAEGIK